MLYPQKNLIPPFTDSGWFKDGNPTWIVNSSNPHAMTMTLPLSANGILIHIPVEMGKTYTFSFKSITGLYRLYKRKVLVHDTNTVLVQDSNVGKPDSYTFKVDSSYQGFLTVRLTHSIAGTFTYENLQLEEGSLVTNFKPYKLGNKQLSRRYGRKNLLDMYDSRWTLRSGTTYVTRSGSRFVWDSSADYGGVQIMLNDADFVGKTITFGGKRHSDTGVLFYYKKPDGSAAYVGLASNEQYRTLSVPYGSSECRFYVQNNAGARNNAFWSEDLFIFYGTDNVFTPYKEGSKEAVMGFNKIVDITTEIGNFIIDTGVKAPNATAIRSKDFAAVQPNTLVRVSTDRKLLTGGSTRIFEYDSQYQFIRSNLAASVTTHPNTRYVMFHAIMAGEGVNAATKFIWSNSKSANISANMYPKKNLIKPFTSSDWLLSTPFKVEGAHEGSLTSSTPAWDTSKLFVNVEVGQTYTIQAEITGGFAVELWENNVNKGAFAKSSMRSRTQIATYPVWEIRIVRDGQATGTMTIKDLMLSKSPARDTFEPYKFGVNKPALLYPKKNMLTLEGSTLTTAGGSSMTILSPNDVVVTSGTNGFTAVKTPNIRVKPYTQYTISYIGERISSTDALRVSPRKSSDASGISLSDGEGAKTLTFNTGSETEIFLLLYANLATTAAPQSNKYTKIQLEEGTTATSFERFKLVNKQL